MRRSLPLLALASLTSLGVLASCSSSNNAFDQRWTNTPPPMTANPAALMDGKWEGTWQSDATDYHGHLQSIITLSGAALTDKQPVQQYTASIEMRLFEVSVKQYDVKLNATKMSDGRLHFEGAKDLGYNDGGLFHYEGYIDPDKDQFFCEYTSDKDSGTFIMRRITLENQ